MTLKCRIRSFVFVMLTLAGMSVCDAQLLTPPDGSEQQGFPIEFKWKSPRAGDVHLKIWNVDTGEFEVDQSITEDSHYRLKGGLAPGRYKWTAYCDDVAIGGNFTFIFNPSSQEAPTGTSTPPAGSTVPVTSKPKASPTKAPVTQPPSPLTKAPVTQPPVSTSQGGRGNWFWLFALILVVVIAVAVGITVLVQNWPESRRYGRRTVNPPVTRPLAPDKHVQEPGNDAWLQQVRKIINEKLQEQQQKTMDAVHHHAERSSARVSQEIRHDLADYVSEGELESKLKAMESGLNQSVGQINSALNSDIRGLADRIASIEADLNALRQEKLAKRNAIIMEACKKVDGLISQLAAAIAPATARLLNGLTMASRAEALPQVVKAGQRLTAEFYAIPGGESLRAYMVAIGRLQEVRDKLERLLLSTVSDLTPDSLLREAETVFESYVNAHNHERLSPGLVEQTRQALVNEIGMPYISLVMGRLQGDSVAASQQIARIMQELGYDLIEIVVGKTRPDARYHEVGSAAPTDRHPAGTITSVVRMGYIERTTGEISRAQVIVAA